VATEKKSWGKAAWLSGALLVVPLAGLVALLVLGGDDDDGSPKPKPVAEEPVVVAPPPAPEPLPPARPAPEPVKDEPVADRAEPAEPEEPEEPPSVLDPCCAAIEERAQAEDSALLRSAHRACTNARTFDDPEIGFRTVRRLLERQDYEVPQACQ
jgi:hypothetical protein